MRRLIKFLFIFFMIISFSAFGKKSDEQQPIHIEADSVEIRERENTSIYKGNVKITKGTLLIKGNLIRIVNSGQGLQKIYIEGRPATYTQLNDLNEEVSASSHQMQYAADSGILELTDQAIIIQSNKRFTSDKIIYDTKRDIVQAGKDDKTGNNTNGGRVTITIQPDTKSNKPKDNP